MEAIIDSALDVDKVEYIFHDTHLTGQAVRLTALDSWLEEFLDGQSTTPEGSLGLKAHHRGCARIAGGASIPVQKTVSGTRAARP